jgi:hypothetical protein
MTRFHTLRIVHIAAVAVAAALSATAAVVTSAAAATATTWTVSPGGSWTGPLSSGATFVIQEGVTGTTVTCVSSAMAGTFTAGSGQSGDLGAVTSVSPGTCTGPGGSTYTVATNASSADPWQVAAVAYTASDGITSGDLTTASASGTGVAITLTGPGCTVVLGGTTTVHAYLIFDYQNGNGRLAIPHSTYRPTIRVVSSTCSSWHATDGTRVYTTPVFPGSLAGGFALSPAQTITSP